MIRGVSYLNRAGLPGLPRAPAAPGRPPRRATPKVTWGQPSPAPGMPPPPWTLSRPEPPSRSAIHGKTCKMSPDHNDPVSEVADFAVHWREESHLYPTEAFRLTSQCE